MVRLTPEVGYAYGHFFAAGDTGNAFGWNTHRLLAGARLGLGEIVVPVIYGHAAYGWSDTPDPTVRSSGGFAYDGGLALDLHIVPRLGVGVHAEYDSLQGSTFALQWFALGGHADLAL
jgi:hypothetical protein